VTPSPSVAEALGTYLDVVDSCSPGLVEGLYVVGSFALDDWHPGRSDIDIVAVTADPATDEDAGALRTAHALLTERQPRPPIDGPYLAWGDLTIAPGGVHRPWTLGGELHHDSECFELNPVTWYVLSTYGVTVRGPAADDLVVDLDVEQRIRFVVDNLSNYWQPLADSVRSAVADPQRSSVSADLLEWCALGPLRLHYTAFTGDVTSKRGAGEHGLRVAPSRFHPVLQEALAVRAGRRAATNVDMATMASVAELMTWCVDEVRAADR
jgi:hypothetical protein